MKQKVEDIQVVILAGGRGARFDHESQVKPKPLIEVAGKPMLGHIMDLFELQGFKKFTILGGYLVEQINDYVATRYECRANPPRYDHITVFGNKGQRVDTHVFDTGVDASTGDRLMSLSLDFMLQKPHVLTYGDGLCDVEMERVISLHEERGAEITVTAVHPPGRFGMIELREQPGIWPSQVKSFSEKPAAGWINGGFMYVNNGVVPRFVPRTPFDDAPFESFESGALVRAASASKLHAYQHEGYWRCMDTRRDLEQIEADVAANGGVLPWIKRGRE